MAALSHAQWLRLHRIANNEFDVRARQILPEWWSASTPCEEWDVYDLFNHVVVQSMWVPALLAGHHPDTIGGLDGDVIEGDPLDVWEDARATAIEAADASGASDEVYLPTGVTTAADYIRQRTVDLAVHAWDLGRATAGDTSLDSELVDAIAGLVWPIASRFSAGSDDYEPSLPADSTDDTWSSVLRILGRDPD